MPKPSDLLQGTLDLLILRTLQSEPLHGWGVAKRISLVSGDALAVGQGSLYPALHRLEQQGWIKAEWKDSELGRSATWAVPVFLPDGILVRDQTSVQKLAWP